MSPPKSSSLAIAESYEGEGTRLHALGESYPFGPWCPPHAERGLLDRRRSRRGQGAVRLPHGPALAEPETAALRVLPWAGFAAAVSYTFDDSNSSQIENYERLAAMGVPLTFYLATGKRESEDAVWARALDDGHELGNHGHLHRAGGSLGELVEDVDRASAFIEDRFGVRPWSLAAPFGSHDYVPVARQRFFANRGVRPGIVLPEDRSDPWALDCFVPTHSAEASEFNGRVDAARRRGGWEIVLIHGFEGGTDQAYRPVALNQLEGAVHHARSYGDVWIGTLMDVASYWLGQRALSDATVLRLGRTLSYRWRLPEHFPPGKFLRVRSSGRGISQGGEAVRSTFGYYDIALDRGELQVLL